MQQAATCQRLCHAACQRKTASSPPKPCHHQSQRYTRSVMPLAKKQQAPRQPYEVTQSKKVGPQRFEVGLPVFVSAQPPCLQKSSKAGVPPLLHEGNRFADKKPSPVGRAEDMPVCLFAQGPFASAEYLVQLTSSLAQKVCLARGSPCPPGEWLKSHIAQQSTRNHETSSSHPPALHRRSRHRHHSPLRHPPRPRIPNHLHKRNHRSRNGRRPLPHHRPARTRQRRTPRLLPQHQKRRHRHGTRQQRHPQRLTRPPPRSLQRRPPRQRKRHHGRP